MEWLAPFDPARIYERSLEVFLEGTGEWFLDGTFARWLNRTGPPVLWLRAKRMFTVEPLLPKACAEICWIQLALVKQHCCKLDRLLSTNVTWLISYPRTAAVRRARTVLEDKHPNRSLACFYCSFSHQETHDVRTIIASLLAQLCENTPGLWEDINEQYHSSKGQRRQMQSKMSLQEGADILKKGGQKLSGAYLFLDAINESQQSRKMLNLIKDLLQHIPLVRIMMSSTEELDEPFEPQEVEVIAMDRRGLSRDVHIYIGDWLENDPHLSNLPDSLKAKISSTLQSGNHGVYVAFGCYRRKKLIVSPGSDGYNASWRL